MCAYISATKFYFYFVIVCLWIVALVHSGACISCVQCDSKITGLSCVMQAPNPSRCAQMPYGSLGYCMTMVTFDMNRKLQSFSRSCSPALFEDKCTVGIDRDTGDKKLVCYATCSKNGCNGRHSLPYLVSLI